MKAEYVARAIVDILKSEDTHIDVMGSGYINSRTFGLKEVVIDGHYDLIGVVKKLQELGIIESSEDK